MVDHRYTTLSCSVLHAVPHRDDTAGLIPLWQTHSNNKNA
ncbi:hypothetical protein BURMUCGD2M_5824 [Burkholderia multivorans CGD2M]|uniref:Uncharacterized protein n=1 Tax=Burkholderia multivorans CGD2 TaxID=513052 RepID=B9BL77_9BURK|nr:hypothetical protein BURMUCGD2_5835 [Burkholderia multivorans CGD2]EEE16379.1 hypothetical protein BURMUCGD2M_5824 [Burkholderia multivorans CGD2M]